MRSHLLLASMLFLASFLTYIGFLQDPSNANVSSRMFLTLELVGHKNLSIDRNAAYTVDKSKYQGKFYSDKAPGLSFMAFPVTKLLLRPIVGVNDPGSTDKDVNVALPPSPYSNMAWSPSKPYYILTYFATVSTSALITSVSVAALFLVALSVFDSLIGSILVAVAYGFATPAFGWATAFVGHAPAMGLLFIGFACLHFIGHKVNGARYDFLLTVVGLACLTWAVITEFTAAPVAAAVAGYSYRKIIAEKRYKLMLVCCALLTVIVFSIPLFFYNYLAFGSPWSLGYGSVQGFPGMKEGVFGINMPQLSVLYEITFGSYRGILQICPLLLLLPIGLLQMGMRETQRGLALLILFVVTYYLLLNSAYYYWDGGWSTGPRHITGMLPFACLALGAVWNSQSRTMQTFMLLLILVSSVLALICTSTGMFAPSHYQHLVLEYLIPSFFEDISTAVPVQLFGWHLRYFLLGLLAMWICLASLIARQVGRILATGLPSS